MRLGVPVRMPTGASRRMAAWSIAVHLHVGGDLWEATDTQAIENTIVDALPLDAEGW